MLDSIVTVCYIINEQSQTMMSTTAHSSGFHNQPSRQIGNKAAISFQTKGRNNNAGSMMGCDTRIRDQESEAMLLDRRWYSQRGWYRGSQSPEEIVWENVGTICRGSTTIPIKDDVHHNR